MPEARNHLSASARLSRWVCACVALAFIAAAC
jgi:hypothetical protein